MRKIRQLVFLIMFLPGAVQAALFPLGWGIAIATGVSATSLILPMIAASVVVGAAISWVTIGGTPNSESQTAPIMVQIDPKAPIATPSGWTEPVAPSPYPTPPGTAGAALVGPVVSVGDMPAFCLSSPVGTKFQYLGQQSLVVGANNAGAEPGFSFGDNCGGAVGSPEFRQRWGKTNNCPAGYSNSGGTCVLTNASIVQKPSDSRCYIVRTGNTYAADPNDPDCAAGMPAEWSAGPNSITWTGRGNGDGGGSVAIDPGTGEVTIIGKKQNSDATTTTTTIKGSAPNASAAPGAGVTVKGISETTQPGVGSEAGALPGSEFPTDYNRETTQQSVAAKLDAITGVLTPGADPDYSGATSSFNAARDAHITAIENAGNRTETGISLDLGLPAASSCEALSFAMPGGANRLLTIDWCAQQPKIKQILAFIVALLTVLYLFTLVNELIAKT